MKQVNRQQQSHTLALSNTKAIISILLCLLIATPTLLTEDVRASEDLIPSPSKNIIRNKSYPEAYFFGDPSAYNVTIRFSFYLNGSIKIEALIRDKSFIFQLRFATTGLSIFLYSNSSHVAYNIQGSRSAVAYNVWILFDFSPERSVKITLKGTLSKAATIGLQFNFLKGKYWQESTKRLWSCNFDKTLGITEGFAFDWSEAKVPFSFNNSTDILSFPVGTNFFIDPSTVATTNIAVATWHAYQRKTFKTSERHWVSWSDGANYKYSSSTDGSTWASATTIGTCDNGEHASLWYDGTYVHYSRHYNYYLYYRRGIPYSNGTITWSASEQTVYAGSSSEWYNYPMIAVDSLGYPWIACRHVTYFAPEEIWFYTPACFKSSVNNSGSWTTASGFPYDLNAAIDNTNSRASLCPLLSQKMYVAYGYGSALLYGKQYTPPSTWSSEESATSNNNLTPQYHSTVAQGDTIYLAYTRTPYEVKSSLESGQDTYESFYGAIWKGQSFKPAGTAELQRAEVYIARGAGTSSVNIQVYAYAADANDFPTGSALATSSIASFTSGSYSWKVASFSEPRAMLITNSKYVLVLSATSGTSSQYYIWGADGSSPPYTDGMMCYSGDSGSHWYSLPTKDALFKVIQNTVELRYRNRSSGGTWASEELIDYGDSDTAVTLTIDTADSNLTAIYAGSPFSHHICYRYKNSTAYWNQTSRIDWINEETDKLTRNDLLTSFAKRYSETIGIAYVTRTSAPYNVRYAFLAPAKSWHEIASWYLYLIGRSWFSIAEWNLYLITRDWHDIASWTLLLIVRDWHDISLWNFILVTRTWFNVETWWFSLIARAWQEVAEWFFFLGSLFWIDIAFWVFTLEPERAVFKFILIIIALFVAGCCFYVAKRRKKKGINRE